MNNTFNSKILIAEDNEDSCLMLRLFLESLDFHVVEARNGEEAVKLANEEQPDLILMDLNMPVIDGITAALHIRSNPELADIPILANSADGLRGMDLFSGIDELGKAYIGYIAKPFSFDELTEQINAALFQNQKRRLISPANCNFPHTF